MNNVNGAYRFLAAKSMSGDEQVSETIFQAQKALFWRSITENEFKEQIGVYGLSDELIQDHADATKQLVLLNPKGEKP